MSNILNNQSSTSRNNPNFQSLVVTGKSSFTGQDSLILTGTSAIASGIDTAVYNASVQKLVGSNLSYDSKTGNISISIGGSGKWLVSYSIQFPNNGVAGIRSAYINISNDSLPGVRLATNLGNGLTTNPTELTGAQSFYYAGNVSTVVTLNCTQTTGASMNVTFSICLDRIG